MIPQKQTKMDFELCISELKGRHLKASKAFSAGEVIVKQQPYAAVLYDDQVPHRCDYCYSLCHTPLRCSKSKFARYCSREHQRLAWQEGYKTECEALSKSAPRVPPATVRLACRVLWQRYREANSNVPQSRTYESIHNLVHHWEPLEDFQKSMYAQMAVVTREFYSSGVNGNFPDIKEIAKLLARFACNNHTICDEELRPIGVGIYPLAALINHSCQPNCMQSFKGSTILFRAVRDIAPGEELTISYVELAVPRWERRQALLHMYCFDINQSDGEGDAPPQVSCCDINQSDRQGAAPPPVLLRPHAVSNSSSHHRTAAAADLAAPPDAETLSGCHNQRDASPTAPLSLHDAPPVRLASLPAAAYQVGQEVTAGSHHCSDSTSSAAPADEPHTSVQEDAPDTASLATNHHEDPAGTSPNSQRPHEPVWEEGAAARPSASAHAGSAGGTCSQGSQLGGASISRPSPSDEVHHVDEVELASGMRLRLLPDCLHPPWRWDEGDLQLVGLRSTAGKALEGGLYVRSVVQEEAKDSFGMLEDDTLADSDEEQAASPPTHCHLTDRDQELLDKVMGRTAAASPAQSSVEVTCWGGWWRSQPGGGIDVREVAEAAAKMLRGQEQAEALSKAGRHHAAMSVLKQALELADGRGSGGVVLGPAHQLRMRLMAGLLKATVDMGDSWEEALGAARALAPIYSAVYPKVWPNLGLHYAMLAKLENLVGEPAAAADACAAALVSLKVTHPDSSLLDDLLRLQYQLSQELSAEEPAWGR